MTPASGGSDTLNAGKSRRTVPAEWLPARYREPWKGFLLDRAESELRPGIRVLDVGSGARPAIPPEQRPEGCVYVGLDLGQRARAREIGRL